MDLQHLSICTTFTAEAAALNFKHGTDNDFGGAVLAFAGNILTL